MDFVSFISGELDRIGAIFSSNAASAYEFFSGPLHAIWAVLSWCLQYLILWVFNATTWSAAITNLYALFFGIVHFLLPEALQGALADTVTFLAGATSTVTLVFSLAFWMVSFVTNPATFAACFAAYFAALPTCLGVRLALRVVHHFWGSD